MLALYAVLFALTCIFVFGVRAGDRTHAINACFEAISPYVPGIALDRLTADAVRVSGRVYRVEHAASMNGRLMTWECRARQMPDGSWAAAPE